MSLIGKTARGVHVVRVKFPNGTIHELFTCGLRKALRIANALSGWLSVDDWESASAMMPLGVQRVRRSILKDFPRLDLTRVTVEVAHPGEGPDAENGYEVIATYRPGSIVPQIVANIRAEALEAGWREDKPHSPRGPHPRPQSAAANAPDDDESDPDDTLLHTPDTSYRVESD